MPAQLDGRAFEFIIDDDQPRGKGLTSLQAQKVRFIDGLQTYDVAERRVPLQAAPKTDSMLKHEYIETKNFLQKELK